ncbi:hypothetical protein [Oryza sativa Japonica Group]|uniref:Protein MIZU-KUSSEI 1 n=2 Tax=Oryza sativa subsp. japonica TaxID=39947 RepID=Q5NBJ0_ORYSJ|nr:hypothetical protein [Oryza sativa Japonica Group]BAD81166.1 hypothetical protein [Oryza sativa Japonica Group]
MDRSGTPWPDLERLAPSTVGEQFQGVELKPPEHLERVELELEPSTDLSGLAYVEGVRICRNCSCIAAGQQHHGSPMVVMRFPYGQAGFPQYAKVVALLKKSGRFSSLDEFDNDDLSRDIKTNTLTASSFHARPSVGANARRCGFLSKIKASPLPTARRAFPLLATAVAAAAAAPFPAPTRRPPPPPPPPPRCPGGSAADRHMTQPPRRPDATETTTAFLGAASTPSPRPAPATPLPDAPSFLLGPSTPLPPPLPPPTSTAAAAAAAKAKHQKQQQQQTSKHWSRPARFVRSVRAAFRSFPILPAPSCRGLPSLPHLPGLHHGGAGGAVRNHFHGSTRTTGTLYGHRRARITIAFHDSPGSPPALLLDIAVPTAKFIQDVSAAGMVRVTLECDKQQHQPPPHAHPPGDPLPPRRLLDEPVWSAEVNGESVGYAARREATEADERVMRLLHAMSMGAGVLPAVAADAPTSAADGEVTYMRAHFDRVVGSKDAETYYMHNPEGCATGPELTIFFIRT